MARLVIPFAPGVPKGETVRKNVVVAGVSLIMLFTLAGVVARPAAPPKSAAGTIVIVFKDGHRQTFNLSDIERVEFPAAALTAGDNSPASADAPPRGHYVGKWECGDGNGSNFYITLKESGDAMRSIGDEHGRWVYVNGEARVTWDDGAQDAIRKIGVHYQKLAYREGKSFTDQPDNVTNAKLTNPRPI
jgi:hypothetical protein